MMKRVDTKKGEKPPTECIREMWNHGDYQAMKMMPRQKNGATLISLTFFDSFLAWSVVLVATTAYVLMKPIEFLEVDSDNEKRQVKANINVVIQWFDPALKNVVECIGKSPNARSYGKL